MARTKVNIGNSAELYRICSSLLLTFCSFLLLSQPINIGIPNIINFSKNEYGGGTQNWAGFSLDNGINVFANNSGLLIFNRIEWTLYKLPNKSILRSIAYSDSKKIYVGGQDEIGYFEAKKDGSLEFYSLRDLIPEKYLPLEDVWEVVTEREKVYFRSVNKIFIFTESQGFEVIDPQHPIVSIEKVRSEIYYIDLFEGIVKISDGLSLLPWSSFFKYIPIVGLLPYEENGFIILTEQGGAYTFDGELKAVDNSLNNFLKGSRIHQGIQLKNNNIALATQFQGLIMLDTLLKPYAHINKKSGLQNNNILSLFEDELGDLWLGTSNGIDKIEYHQTLKSILPDKDQEGSIYDIEKHENKLYFGTNNGLFYCDLSIKNDGLTEIEFTKVKYTDGQVWGLDIVGDDLLMGHNEGAFVVSGNEVRKISKTPGAWKFTEIDSITMYVGTYNGVDVYRKENNTWSLYKPIVEFDESSRIMIKVKDNEIWVSHPYRGVYKISHNANFDDVHIKSYNQKDGLASDLLNYVFDINGKPYVCSETGVFVYDEDTDRFVSDEAIAAHFNQWTNIKRLVQSGDVIWYITDEETGFLSLESEGTYSKTTIPDLANVFVGGFENLYLLDKENVMACTDKGVSLYSIPERKEKVLPQVYIAEFRILSNTENNLHGGFSDLGLRDYTFSHLENAFEIKFSSSDHSPKSKYRYRLLNNDKKWSEWLPETRKEYNNLSHGTYDFQVQVTNKQGVISDVQHFKFEITPPWYYTNVAYGLYFLAMLVFLLGLIFIPKQKHKKEKQVLTLANEQSGAEIERLKNEQLLAEIDHKNRELATSTLHLVQKNETLGKLRSEIVQVQRKIKDVGAAKELKKVISVLSDDERLEEDWESFSQHFDQVHSDFLKRLKQDYPQLSPKDQKMAAYLRMNLSTKEIAPLLNISIRGVEISRYRLRKKLELEKHINLSEFMMEY